MQVTTFCKNRYSINCRGRLLEFEFPLIMGILNITEDSFYDGGRYKTKDKILLRVEEMLKEGVDIIDVGGMSTRPVAKELSVEEEKDKIYEVVFLIRSNFKESIISVDTYRSEVARIAMDSGADMINDVSGGDFDEKMFDFIIERKVPYVLMHTRGKPEVMQNNPQYDDVVKDIIKILSEKINRLESKGVKDIIIDPGFGFGKTIEHNYEILKNLKVFSFLDKPILVGLSRKSMIYKVLGVGPEEALIGTSALNMVALLNGANILRVHDVKAAKQLVELYKRVV